MTETGKCPERLIGAGGFHMYACGKPAKGEHGFCGIHAPEAVASRREKSRERDRAVLKAANERAAKALADRKALTEELPRLRALLEERNAVCLCGCPADAHESLGEDGESCGNDSHECIRVAPAVLASFRKLRAMVVLLAASCASEFDGTGGPNADPMFWVREAEGAALASLAKSAAKECAACSTK